MSEIKTVTGSIKLIQETREYGSNGFTKRVMVIDVVDGEYINPIPVEAVKDKCSMFDSLNVGDEVSASVNLRGSEWNDRFFLSLNCWKIDVLAQDTPSEPQNALSDFIGVVNDALGQVNNEAPQMDSEIPF